MFQSLVLTFIRSSHQVSSFEFILGRVVFAIAIKSAPHKMAEIKRGNNSNEKSVWLKTTTIFWVLCSSYSLHPFSKLMEKCRLVQIHRIQSRLWFAFVFNSVGLVRFFFLSLFFSFFYLTIWCLFFEDLFKFTFIICNPWCVEIDHSTV